MSLTSFLVLTGILLVLLMLFLHWLSGESRSGRSFATASRREAERRSRIVLAALSFDLSQARRRYAAASSGLSDDDVAFHEREFRRYFAILALHPGVTFGLKHGPVDEYWHALIGCTALYRSFCSSVAGRFVDHDPDGGGGGTYGRTWNAYRALFGEDPPASVWEVPSPEERQAAASKVASRDDAASSGADDGSLPLLLFFDDSGSQLSVAGHHGGDGGHHGDGGGHGGDGGHGGGGDGGGGDGGGGDGGGGGCGGGGGGGE